MAPRYPFARQHPSTAHASSSYDPHANDKPVVVSASGVNPKSPSEGLSMFSPANLRARIPSPRNPFGFANESARYPSPTSAAKSRLISLVKKRNKSQSGKGWLRIDTESPTKDTTPARPPLSHHSSQSSSQSSGQGHATPRARDNLQVPRYDARGYPVRPGQSEASSPAGSSHSSQNRQDYPFAPQGNHLSASDSRDSLLTGESSTLAAHSYDDDRPSTYYYQSGSAPNGTYPPAVSFSSDTPYDPYRSNPLQREKSLAESTISALSQASYDSYSNLKKYDALKEEFRSVIGRRHLSEMFHLPADPASWSYLGPEADDDFHDPDHIGSKLSRVQMAVFTLRGISNVGCLILLFLMMLAMFAGYPILSAYLIHDPDDTYGAYNLGGINSTGQIPNVGPFALIDKDTPQSAYTHTSLETGESWELIFSDEFNRPGRTFYPGDDPYWEAVDLHYWETNNLEWYDPRQITTRGGALVITLDNTKEHGLNYRGGMMTGWNQFCFTGGYVEAAVSLPGKSDVYGLWPAIWTMGNLGRAGYGGSLDGVWPYSYDSCDVGTLKNQTLNGQPVISTTSGPDEFDGSLSYLPGQRLSACTCPNDPTHPGPKTSNGSFVGRSAPEIDLFEATTDITTLTGQVSQSGQWAPFNPEYTFINTSTSYEIYDDDITTINPYAGSVYQQATSALTNTDQDCYAQEKGCFSSYGFEYNGGTDGYITWVSNGTKSWTIRGSAMGPNTAAEIGSRPISTEPMYLIMNLGLSKNFGAIDFDGLDELWPVEMQVDYIRVYQDPNQRNLGCDPPNMPTAEYISLYPDAYANPNITTFEQVANAKIPGNRLIDTC